MLLVLFEVLLDDLVDGEAPGAELALAVLVVSLHFLELVVWVVFGIKESILFIRDRLRGGLLGEFLVSGAYVGGDVVVVLEQLDDAADVLPRADDQAEVDAVVQVFAHHVARDLVAQRHVLRVDRVVQHQDVFPGQPVLLVGLDYSVAAEVPLALVFLHGRQQLRAVLRQDVRQGVCRLGESRVRSTSL